MNRQSLLGILAAVCILGAALQAFGAQESTHLSVPSKVINGDSVEVTWKNTAGNQQDWVTVVKAGTSEKEWGKWTYLKGKQNGTFTVKGLSPGEYEARLYYDYPKGGFTVIDRVVFTIQKGGPTGSYISLDASEYSSGKTVVVSWSGTPGNQQDWITVVPAGKSDKEWGKWTYLKGKKSGTFKVEGLAAGDYEVRLYYDYPKGGFTVIERLTFKVL